MLRARACSSVHVLRACFRHKCVCLLTFGGTLAPFGAIGLLHVVLVEYYGYVLLLRVSRGTENHACYLPVIVLVGISCL
jgi:hypothetical protein